MKNVMYPSLDESVNELAYQMYRKAVRFGTWDPAKIDFTQDKKDFEALDDDLKAFMVHFITGFKNAEENVAIHFCPWVMMATTTDWQAFLSTQLFEEFKHAELFDRFFKEVIGREPIETVVNVNSAKLQDRSKELILALEKDPAERERELAGAVTHYMGINEGVQAVTGYEVFFAVFGDKGLFPGLAQGYRYIQMDEGRHVGFGIRLLRKLVQNPELAAHVRGIYEEYYPIISKRYDQNLVVDGREIPYPPEVHGKERIIKNYNRRLKDIFGPVFEDEEEMEDAV